MSNLLNAMDHLHWKQFQMTYEYKGFETVTYNRVIFTQWSDILWSRQEYTATEYSEHIVTAEHVRDEIAEIFSWNKNISMNDYNLFVFTEAQSVYRTGLEINGEEVFFVNKHADNSWHLMDAPRAANETMPYIS